MYSLFVQDNRLYRYFLYRHRFPELSVATSADLDIKGQFNYDSSATVGNFSRIIVFGSGRLTLSKGTFIGRCVEVATDNDLYIGEDTSIQDFSVVVGRVTIGEHCLVSYGLMMTSGQHNFRLRENWLIRDQDELVRNVPELVAAHDRAITIEDDCWIGAHAVLMPGITIGKGSIIGANSVVTKDISPYSVAVGTPARVIHKRLEFLPPARIEANNSLHLPYFYSGFSVTQRALARIPSLDGIAASRRFSIAVAAAPGKAVSLLARTIDGNPARIRFGDQTGMLQDKMWVVSFKLQQESGSVLQFSVETDAPGHEVAVVASAWVE